ncbi:acyltransferase domain-containing protein, partial [Streptomyces spectabilis]|uniref:acyltransferase domain-containing protein n=1 Tax=Streptomyces spectabilis TaxID=68270 RepID=UPI0033C44B5B
MGLADWAALVAAVGDRPRDTAVTYVGPAPPARAAPLPDEGDLPIAERVLRFQLAASGTAAGLAAHVALSVPALPVMRLIQQRVTPGSRPSDLAEVLLSGLLEPVDLERGRYDFVPGARAALIETLPRPESLAVTDLLTRIGEEIAARAGSAARSFPAVVPVADGTGTRGLGAAGEPFALVSEEALGVLRGRAIRVAERPAAPPPGSPAPRAAPAPRGPAHLPSPDLPAQGTFVGRAEELRRLDELLGAPGPHPDRPRAVVVHGAPGVGKSSLAARWCEAARSSLSPVWWLTARSPQDLTDGLAKLARNLDPSATGAVTSEQRSQWAVHWLAAHDDWALVLDDAENPADVAALLERLGPGGRVLVTTRRAQGWEGVGPLLELGAMEPVEAASLLRVRLDQDLTEGDAHSLAEALGHLPLALSMAAEYMAAEGVSPAQYLMLLERDRATPRSDPIRMALRTVDDPSARRVLTVLACLAPEPVPLRLLSGIDGTTALARAAETLEGLRLISAEGETLRMHPLVHEFLNEPDESDPWRGPAAVRAARREAMALLDGALPSDTEDPATWPRWQSLLPHIDHMAERIAEQDDSPRFVHVLEKAADYVIGQGQLERGIGMLRRAVQGREREGGFPAGLRTTRQLVSALRRAGRLSEAVRRCEEAAALAATPDHPDALLLRVELAALKHQSGEADVAWQQFTKLYTFALHAPRRASPDLFVPCAAVAGLALTLGEPRMAVQLYEATLAAVRRELGEDHPDTLVVRGRLAAALYAVGERGRASREGTQVLVDLTRVFGADHPRVISALSDVAHALEGTEDGLPDAVNAYAEALRRSRAARGEAHPETQRLWDHLFDAEARAGNRASAVEVAEEWRSAAAEALGAHHRATLRASARLAGAYAANGDWSLAISTYERTLELQRETLGEDSPETWESYDRLAALFAEVGDEDRALPLYERALRARRESLGEGHEETLAALDRTALALLGAGRHGRAVELLDRALDIRRRVLGEAHADVLKTYNYLGYAHREAGDPALAVITYRTALRGCAELFGEADSRTVAMIRNLVEAHLSGGDRPGAVEVLEHAVAALTPALGADHRDVRALKDELARLRPRETALRHGVLPATLHVDAPTPQVDWSAGAVELLTEARDWARNGRPRRAGVSAFGASGTNAHLILEEAPEAPAAAEPEPSGVVPLVVSAGTTASLAAQAERLASYLESGADGASLPAVAGTLATGRAVLGERAVVVADTADEALTGLRALARGEHTTGLVTGAGTPGKVVWVFPGQGSQWVGMGRELLDSSPVFAQRVEECATALERWVDWSLVDVLRGEVEPGLWERVDVVQPASFAVMVGLAAVWASVGIEPDAVLGHSQGEIAAACVAGALSLEDAARVVALRSQAIAARLAGRGGMASVALSESEAAGRLAPWSDRVEVAAVNGPSSVVVAGDTQALDEALEALDDQGVRIRRVAVDYASHTRHVEDVRDTLAEVLAGITAQAPTVPFHSTVTGARVEDAGALDGAYWYRNLREPVRFGPAVADLLGQGHTVFVEISAHPVLVQPITEAVDAADADVVVTGTLRRDDGGPRRLLTSMAELFVRGTPLDWAGTLPAGATSRRVDLPTYAFDHQHYWIRMGASATDSASLGLAGADHPLLGAVVPLPQSDGLVFTSRLSLRSHPWLADHAIGGVVLVPGTVYVDLAVRAGDEFGHGLLEELVIEAPLVLPDSGGVRLQVAVSGPGATGSRTVDVYSRREDDDAWTRHATGLLAASPAVPGPGREFD